MMTKEELKNYIYETVKSHIVVKCDKENNTEQSIKDRYMNVDVIFDSDKVLSAVADKLIEKGVLK